MILKDRVAVVFAATGAIGRQVAMAFAKEGASVCVSGRDGAAAEAVAAQIRAGGGQAHAARVDATDEGQVEEYFEQIENSVGAVDLAMNAIGIRAPDGAYGTPCTALSYEQFMLPIHVHAGSQFLTARAAARRMAPRGRGVILMLSASLGAEARPFMAGVSAACAAIESLTRSFAADLSPGGVRVLGLRPGPIVATRTIRDTLIANAQTAGMPLEQFTGILTMSSVGRRTVNLDEVAGLAVLLASDYASGMTADNVNVSQGLAVR